MKILERLFGGTAMEEVEEQTESDLSARLSEITTAINAGNGDLVALLEERDGIARQLEAQRIRKAVRADEAYRANIEAKGDEFRTKLIPCAEEVADLVPRLLWHLRRLESLELESLQGVGNVSFEETGMPFGFAKRAAQAIRDAAPNVEWHFDFVSDPSARNPLPATQIERRVLLQARATDVYGNVLTSRRIG
ncbi:MAG: hypothetical protein ACR2L2_07010 [Acidobacteriota bacterium]